MTAATDAATPVAVESKTAAWLALLVAGAIEVGYALSVKGSQGFTEPGWSISAFIFFLLTLFFLSVALKGIDVGIGYAVWAGIGAIGAAVLGPFFFAESLTPGKAFWLAVIIAGVVWLKLADSPRLTAAQDHHSGQAGGPSGTGRRPGSSRLPSGPPTGNQH